MVLNIAQRLPVVGDIVTPIVQKDITALLKNSLRILVSAVAVVALNFFPALTARVIQLPYVGSYLAQAVIGFQSLSPLTQKVAIGAISMPALMLGGGIYFVANAVTSVAQAQMTWSVISALDVAAKFLTGAMLLHKYKELKVGALEV